MQGFALKKMMSLTGAVLFLHGCTYAISPDLVRQADRSLPFEQIELDPAPYKGTVVILGGSIRATAVIENGVLIEVQERPLDHWGKPLSRNKSGGSFIIRHRGYLDAAAFMPGRDITVAGEVQGDRRVGLSNADTRYPVVLSRELKLWPPQKQSSESPRYLDPLYDPHTPPSQF